MFAKAYLSQYLRLLQYANMYFREEKEEYKYFYLQGQFSEKND